MPGRAALRGEGLQFFLGQVIGCNLRSVPGMPEHEVEHQRRQGQGNAEQDGGNALGRTGDVTSWG